MQQAEILTIKIGQVETIAFADGSIYETAIRKKPMDSVVIHSLGAEGNDVGLKAHHGGVDKALFFMAEKTFLELNKLLDRHFSYLDTATYGENFVVSELDEEQVCIGDRYQIDSVIVEVSQPRKPCERLSKNTEHEKTQQIVFKSGLTGWYVRVIQTGQIQRGDKLVLLSRPYPNLTIMKLNKLLAEKPTEIKRADFEMALNCPELAEAFKHSLQNQMNKLK